MSLENVVSRVSIGLTASDVGLSEKYVGLSSVLYSGKPLIIDLPSTKGQVHLHENDLGIQGGRLYDYARSVHTPIDAYQGAMLDHYAKKLDLNRY